MEPLPRDEIHLWITLPSQSHDNETAGRYHQILTEQEFRHTQRYKFIKDRHAALVSRAFIRNLLSIYADAPPSSWRFSKNSYGKPEVISYPFPLRFNLSHSRGLMICALALEHDLGADVEYVNSEIESAEIAGHFFAPTEVQELLQLPSKESRQDRFYDYWTLKESYIKARGKGLSLSLEQFSFHIGDNRDAFINHDITLSFSAGNDDRAKAWQSWLLYPTHDYRMALSIRDGGITGYKLRIFEIIPLVSWREVGLPFDIKLNDTYLSREDRILSNMR